MENDTNVKSFSVQIMASQLSLIVMTVWLGVNVMFCPFNSMVQLLASELAKSANPTIKINISVGWLTAR